MYRKILIPLDGSELAECTLPYAEELAKGCDTEEVTLISVTERVRGQTKAPEAQELYGVDDKPRIQKSSPDITVTFGKMQRQAQRYLGRTAKRLEDKGVKVQTEVLIGEPAEEIVSFAEHNDAEIIVMSSHGRSGPSRRAHGRVADRVLKASCIPVLMVRAPGCVPEI
jgi:nucleotide-binding universal stress UspA family protein